MIMHIVFYHISITRVFYLARARAMACLVLAQIEFTRAICGSRKILPMLQYNVIFFHSNRKMHEIIAADSGLYIVGHYTGHRGHYTGHYIL